MSVRRIDVLRAWEIARGPFESVSYGETDASDEESAGLGLLMHKLRSGGLRVDWDRLCVGLCQMEIFGSFSLYHR